LVRQWVLALPIPLRLPLTAKPKLATPVLQVVHHMTTGPPLKNHSKPAHACWPTNPTLTSRNASRRLPEPLCASVNGGFGS